MTLVKLLKYQIASKKSQALYNLTMLAVYLCVE